MGGESCEELPVDGADVEPPGIPEQQLCNCTSDSGKGRFLGLPGAPLSLKMQGSDKVTQREQPFLSPEHLSFRVPIRCCCQFTA